MKQGVVVVSIQALLAIIRQITFAAFSGKVIFTGKGEVLGIKGNIECSSVFPVILELPLLINQSETPGYWKLKIS